MNQYREGKVKRTPARGVPRAYCIMSRLVILVSKVKRKRAAAKASPNRANQLAGIDAKRDDLPLARLKVG